VLARAAAQLHPMALGLPVALLAGLMLMAVLARGLQAPVEALFEQAFTAARAITG
jgi:flagellar biosynthetic protein FliR